MKTLVIGNGFISGHLLFDKYEKSIIPDVDFIQKNVIDRHKPDVIINCIGRTGTPNIDWCEKFKSETTYANTLIPIALAESCKKNGIHFIHLGSGCIFAGQSPHITYNIDQGWRETDFANPKSFYSKTKYAADLIIAEMNNTTILRLRMPISSTHHPRNLLNKIIGYKKVLEELNSVSFLDDLVRVVDWIIANQKTGIYNITSPSPITHSMLLDEYKKYVPTHVYEKISANELDKLTVAPRSNCILDSKKIISEGFEFEPVVFSIQNCIEKYVKV